VSAIYHFLIGSSRGHLVRVGLVYIGFLVFYIILIIHVWDWWHIFDTAALADYARQCHALFCLMMVPLCLVALGIIILAMAFASMILVCVPCYEEADGLG
jgi:hypothetical protein